MEKTATLDARELTTAYAIIEVFQMRYSGKQAAVKTDDLLFHLRGTGLNIDPQALRRIIGYIRHHDLMSPGFILSSVNSGYWYSTDQAELNTFVEQQLNRMTNQFYNIKNLHQRLRQSKGEANKTQIKLF